MKPSFACRISHASLFTLLLALLTSCASYPISKSLRQQAKPLSLAQVAANPSAYTRTMVIWGGEVLNTVNDTNGGSIYVLALPLTPHERPEWGAPTTGRFIVRSKVFIEPEAFRRGRLITVAGEISGVETRPVQGIQYLYPVVAARELRLWLTPGLYDLYSYPAWD